MRAAANDFMQGFRYHATASDADGNDILQPSIDRSDKQLDGAQAGFQSVTLPEISVEIAEYREGVFKNTQKYPGPQSFSDITLMRGVTKDDTAFNDMVMASVNGQEYRCDVTIWHYQRSEMGDAFQRSTDTSHRRYECSNAFATRAKPAGDLDSMTGDVSLAEVYLAIEGFDIKYS